MDKKRYTGVIVKSGNKCLLCKRNNQGSYPGMWSIPGGKVEDNEDTKDGAKREFFEETSHDISNLELDFVGVVPRHTRDGKKIKGMMYVYLLNTEDEIHPDLENAIDGDEHSECDYFTADQVDPMKTGKVFSKMLKLVLEK